MLRKLILCMTIVALSHQNLLSSKVNEAIKSPDWWERAVFYQIYPRSFKNSNEDGLGDLQGIISKLDHLKDAGVTATWLSPIFESPGVDQGYDISNYTKIDPIFGTYEDFQALLVKAKELGIKLILDFVPNHTSNEHEWFKKSVKKEEGYEDFYIWNDGIPGDGEIPDPPNNWISNFKGSAWTWVEKRKQYYFHQFAAAQPDLNYRNPKVVEAMKDVLRFWLDIGVNGFRIDAVGCLFEDEKLRDEPKSNLPGYNESDYEYLDHIYTRHLNESFDMVYQWREVVDSYTEGETRVLMTEAYTTFEKTVLYYGNEDGSRRGAHFSFNFFFITLLTNTSTAEDIKAIIDQWINQLPSIYTPNWVLGNHDRPRLATSLGQENSDALIMLISILPGVQVNYNGEEIGMENGEVKCEEGQDPVTKGKCDIFWMSRDFERTPFQWDNSTNAGFNDGIGKPWLPVSVNKYTTNLKDQNVEGVKSHYNTYKSLLELRKQIPNTASVKVDIVKDTVLTVTRETELAVHYYLYNRLGEEVNVEVKTVEEGVTLTVVASSLASEYVAGQTIKGGITLKTADSVILREDLLSSKIQFA